jgi:RNA polymerase-interacting CarD/CdnL/TRCF family regulator
MKKTTGIVKDDVLYHAVHGLCRVDKVSGKPTDEKGGSFSLVPVRNNTMQSRFTIAAADIEESGFHPVVSLTEAQNILKYLSTGDDAKVPQCYAAKAGSSLTYQNKTWGLAQAIVTYEKSEIKSRMKREVLERSAKGLVRELAIVFHTTVKESAAKVQKSLAKKSTIHPLVLEALEQAVER